LSLPLKMPTRLSCEELEPRSPTSMVAASIATAVGAAASVLMSDQSAFRPSVSLSWAGKDERLMVTVQLTSADAAVGKPTGTVAPTSSDSACAVDTGTVAQTNSDWDTTEQGGQCSYALADLSGGLFADPVVDRLIDALVA
jgi:hypothetical protein